MERSSSPTRRSRPTPPASGRQTSTSPAARSRRSTSSSSATTASRSAGTRPLPAPSCPRRSSPAPGSAMSTRSSGSRSSRSTTTLPTRSSSCDEGHRGRSAQAGHPRPAGRGRPGLAAPSRIRRHRDAGRPARRARAGGDRRRSRPRGGRADVRTAARELADRDVRDRDHAVTARAPRPKLAVVTFPGSNDDRDAVHAFELLGADATLVWHANEELPPVDAVVLPGGFSYGDYLRCGAIARFAPVMRAVADFAAGGGPVLGICNGFQVLCEAGLLPGVLRPNASLSFVCRDVPLRVENAETPFTSRCEPGQRLVIPVKHGEGCWTYPEDRLQELEVAGQIVLRYEPDANPNGSLADVAGVSNAEGNVMGLMPHPEHAVDPLLGSPDGCLILGSLVDAARERLAAIA